ncbi:hypothetical protein EJ110_NYTH34321 [Nymphaea thermarum]|nr:hypothetical protein EJ110_NYTH34321 [Nymphaea thermarum]
MNFYKNLKRLTKINLWILWKYFFLWVQHRHVHTAGGLQPRDNPRGGPITVWIHFIRCSGRALILGCVKSKVKYSAFPRTPRLGRREPTLQAQHTTVPWGLAPPALRQARPVATQRRDVSQTHSHIPLASYLLFIHSYH